MKTTQLKYLILALFVAAPVAAQDDAPQQGVRDQLRSQVVRLDENNELQGKVNVIDTVTGQLSAIQKIRIRFVRRGVVKALVTPGPDGTFTARNLEPGMYSMIAAGDDGFLAWAVNIQPRLKDVAKMPKWKRVRYLMQEASDSLDIDSAAVPPSNFDPLKSLLRTYLPKDDSVLSLDKPGDGDDVQPSTLPGSQLKHHQIQLTDDGRLLGRIRRLDASGGRSLRIRQLNVFLLRDNQIVSQEPVSPNGTFAFTELAPNVYSLVAAGRDGFVAFSIDVVAPAATQATVTKSGVIPVGFGLQGGGIEFTIAPASDLNQQNVNQFTDNFAGNGEQVANNDDPPPPPLLPPGAAAPPTPPGFGGGGGAGAGDLASFLTGGALGAGIYAIADNNRSRRRASPARPGNFNNNNGGGDNPADQR